MKSNNISIDYKPLNTAVLFLVFNRLDTTKQVFESIRKARPPRLYIAADGARHFIDGELQRVSLVRDYVLSSIDWECEVKTLFRDQNLGCKLAVSGAINWFFENEEMGIILEDDCLPSQSFFLFCEDLLTKYKDDLRIWHIGGTSTLKDEIVLNNESYYFSYFNHIWGWASWANRWKMYDCDLILFNDFVKLRYIENITKNKLLEDFLITVFTNVYSKKIDTWDYQWYYTTWINRGLSIIPTINLVSNLGFSADATHTSDAGHRLSNMKRKEIDLRLVHPKIMMPNIIYDNFNSDFLFGLNYFNYLKNEIKKIIRIIKLTTND